jgi:16S rRNA (uracil1498-N3)-methyltransferase
VAAAEQCGRTRVPAIEPLRRLPDALTAIDRTQERWLLSVTTPGMAPGRPAGPSLVVLSGPEGGLSQDEERAAREAGFAPVHLGPRVLRAETAPLAVMAWLALAS